MKKILTFISFMLLVILPVSVSALDVDTASELQAALESGQSVTLTDDIVMTNAGKSTTTPTTSRTVGVAIKGTGEITIDGAGHKISSTDLDVLMEVYAASSAGLVVNFKNVVLEGKTRVIDTRSDYLTLNLNKTTMKTTGLGNTQGITAGGSANLVTINIIDSSIDTRKAGYGVITFNPVQLTISNSTLNGYAALYFKAASSSVGSAGSEVLVKNNSYLLSENNYDDPSCSFGTIVFADVNINLTIEDSKIEARSLGAIEQAAIGQYVGTSTGGNKELQNKVSVTGNSAIIVDTAEEIASSGDFEVTIEPGVNSNVEISEDLLPEGTTVVKQPDGSYVAAQTYGFAITGNSNGTTTVDKELAIKGETITITTTPKAGYVLSLLKVTDAKGKEIEVKDGKFTMPESEVLIVSEYSKVYKITTKLNDNNNGEIIISANESIAGEKIEYKITAKDGYIVKKTEFKLSDGKDLTVNEKDFTMPSDDVEISAEIVKVYKITVIDSTNGKLHVDAKEAYEGQNVSVSAVAEDGYIVKSLEVKDAKGNVLTLDDTNLKMPASDITIKVEYAKEHVINKDVDENSTLEVDKEIAVAGEEITIDAQAKEGYELDKIEVLTKDGNEVEVTDGKFVMPNEEVTVKVTSKEIETVVEYNITKDVDSNAVVEVVEKAIAGKEVTIKATAKEGYEIDKIEVITKDGKEVEVKEGKFVMPEEGVTVKVTSKEIVNPETSDINVLSFVAVLTLGTLGIAYTLKKRRFS